MSTIETKKAFEVVKSNLPANLAKSPGDDLVTRFQNLLRESQSLILSGDVEAARRPFADAVDVLSNNKGKVYVFSTKEEEFRIASNNFPEFARFFIESKPREITTSA
jgi:hypothetical protein